MPEFQALTLKIAADARGGGASYVEDQSWQVAFGARPDEPALSLQTRYGGRVGLARLVLMFALGDRLIYEKSAFPAEFKLTLLAPNAVRLEGEIAAGLRAECWFWVMDSQTLGGRINLNNQGAAAVNLQVQVMAQAMQNKTTVPMSLLNLETPQGGTVGLAMGNIGNLQPALLQDGAQDTGRAKLSTPVSLPKGGRVSVRFVHCGLPDLQDSVLGAFNWLNEPDWDAHLRAIEERAAHLPSFDTGDPELDAAIAWSQQSLLRSLVGATNAMPNPVPVLVRTPAFGFSPRGDGSDHIRAWAGYSGLDIFHFAANLAVLEPDLSKGVLRNYLALQEADGWIDGAAGAAGQRGGYLLQPLLAQLLEVIEQYRQDAGFLKECFPKLVKFYLRWFAPDQNRDGDHTPEWSSIPQTGWDVHPSFSQTPRRNTPANIQLAECPDLSTYLSNEGEALAKLADQLGDKKAKSRIVALLDALRGELNLNWHDGRFCYRDRDSNQPAYGEKLFSAKGDEVFSAKYAVPQQGRIVISVDGSATHRPKLHIVIEGISAEGKPIREAFSEQDFEWYNTNGRVVTANFWSEIHHFQAGGLSRVYNYSLSTPDLSRYDVTLLLPLTISDLEAEPLEAVIKDLETLFWAPYGLSSLPNFDPDADMGRIVHPVWVTMLGLGLLRHGHAERSAELFLNLAKAQTRSLVQQGGFFQWYDAQTGEGLGMADHVSGAVSLHWLVQLVGVVVHDGGTLEILRPFALNRAIKLSWHGVRIARSSKGLKIKFESGHTVELPADAAPGIIRDPRYKPSTKIKAEPAAPKRAKKKPSGGGSIAIPLQGKAASGDDLPLVDEE